MIKTEVFNRLGQPKDPDGSLRTQGNCRTLTTTRLHIACSEEITITKVLAERLHATGVADELTDLTKRELLAGIATVLLQDNEVVDESFYGFSDIESRTPVRRDTIHRIFSNTKIITSVAMLMLYEDGKYQLDDPLVKYLPALDNLKVLKTGATDVNDTEALATPPTIRQAFTHTAGFSYGTFQESLVDRLFMETGVQDRNGTLEEMIDKLAGIPLARQPGMRWQYSIATDILARLVEVMSGDTFADFLSTRLFQPLGMTDTGFHINDDQVDRLATLYAPVNMMDESKGLKPMSGDRTRRVPGSEITATGNDRSDDGQSPRGWAHRTPTGWDDAGPYVRFRCRVEIIALTGRT
ncbi:MAG: hypothetical protein CMP98_01795 [Gammaproteobacteria bacterium]|nr:hypothetical protein [Gammaproteobacteria bacterium]OUU11593.1 MAG: hypothetical protein CBB94_01905 [Gammaproteobacteria bacterium TMED34]